MNLNRRDFIATLGASAACVATPVVFAQGAFPSRPITMVVAFGPGTGSDTVARTLAEPMRTFLGVPVIVENKVGGGGVIGTEYVARAAPDGYTLTLGSTSSLGTTPLLNPVAKYRDKDFSFVGGIAKTDYLFFTGTQPDSPKTLQELLARLKASGGSFGSAGIGTITHLATEVLLDRAGVKATHVPYKGSGQVVADVAAGHLQFACDSPAATLQLIRAGKLRPLASTGPSRLEALPDTPTVAESGFPDFQVLAWWALAAPVGTPPDVIKRLGEAVQHAMKTPEIKQRLKGMEIEPMVLGPAEFSAFVARETPFWTAFIKKSGITLSP